MDQRSAIQVEDGANQTSTMEITGDEFVVVLEPRRWITPFTSEQGDLMTNFTYELESLRRGETQVILVLVIEGSQRPH